MIMLGKAREMYVINGGICRGIRKYGKKRVMRFAMAIVAMIKRIFESICLSPILRWILALIRANPR